MRIHSPELNVTVNHSAGEEKAVELAGEPGVLSLLQYLQDRLTQLLTPDQGKVGAVAVVSSRLDTS